MSNDLTQRRPKRPSLVLPRFGLASSGFHSSLPALFLGCGLLAWASCAARALGPEAGIPPPVTNLLQLHRLLVREGSAAVSFRLAGVVCAADAGGNLLVLQDDSAAEQIEMKQPSGLSLEPGERIVLEGDRCVVTRGESGLEIEAGGLRQDGPPPSPAKPAAPSSRPEAGSEILGPGLRLSRLGLGSVPSPARVVVGRSPDPLPESRWAELEGTVTFLHRKTNGLDFELKVGAESLRVLCSDPAGVAVTLLLRSRIRVAGVCQSVHTLDGGFTLGRLLVLSQAQIEPLEIDPELWVTQPLAPVSALFSANYDGLPEPIARVRGRALPSASGQGWLLRDESGEIPVESGRPPVPGPAGQVEALGWRSRNAAGVVLRFVFYRQLIASRRAPGGALPLLTSVEEVKRLPRAEAGLRYPVKIRGVVTHAGNGFPPLLFQDQGHSILVRQPFSDPPARTNPGPNPSAPRRDGDLLSSSNPPREGDYLEIEGETDPGAFAPIVSARRLVWLGRARMPDPVRPTWDQLMNGNLDTEYVEFQGIVTMVRPNRVTLLLRAHTLPLSLPGMAVGELKPYENALVRLRGSLIPGLDARTHQVKLGEIRLYGVQFCVEQAAPADIFATPLKHPSDLLRFDLQAGAFQRVRVSGQILHAGESGCILRDGSTSLRFILSKPVPLRAGDRVEVVGYPDLTGATPSLREALARATGFSPLPAPGPLRSRDLLNIRHEGSLVRIQAALVSQRDEPAGQILEMRFETSAFPARLDRGLGAVPSLPAGSRLELTGVYAGVGAGLIPGTFDSFELLLNSAADARVLSRPSWWTSGHLLALIETLLALLALACLWVALLRRQVEERAAQISEHVRARQIVEHEAVLVRERSRIAQDLHDELGSGLTEIGMLGARARAASTPDQTRSLFVQQMCDRAFQTVATLDEIVWAMNPRHDTLDSMLTYFSIYAERFLSLAGIAWRFERDGAIPDRPVVPGCRHDLFIAFKEALTNIVRHSGATEVSLAALLEQGALRLTLTDNGSGFTPGTASNGGNGLANMRTRLERAGGRFEAAAEPRQGTTLRFLVPLS